MKIYDSKSGETCLKFKARLIPFLFPFSSQQCGTGEWNLVDKEKYRKYKVLITTTHRTKTCPAAFCDDILWKDISTFLNLSFDGVTSSGQLWWRWICIITYLKFDWMNSWGPKISKHDYKFKVSPDPSESFLSQQCKHSFQLQ